MADPDSTSPCSMPSARGARRHEPGSPAPVPGAMALDAGADGSDVDVLREVRVLCQYL